MSYWATQGCKGATTHPRAEEGKLRVYHYTIQLYDILEKVKQCQLWKYWWFLWVRGEGGISRRTTGDLEGSDIALCDTVVVDAYSTFIWAHRMHAKSKPDVHSLQALSDKWCVNVVLRCEFLQAITCWPNYRNVLFQSLESPEAVPSEDALSTSVHSSQLASPMCSHVADEANMHLFIRVLWKPGSGALMTLVFQGLYFMLFNSIYNSSYYIIE